MSRPIATKLPQDQARRAIKDCTPFYSQNATYTLLSRGGALNDRAAIDVLRQSTIHPATSPG